MTSFTVAFTGNSSVLRADFFPEISLNPYADYCCALLDFTTYNSIANIEESRNNKFHYKYKVDTEWIERTISFPTGAYEVEDILKYLKLQLAAEKISLEYEINPATSKAQISFERDIEWKSGTVLNVIGFHNNPEGDRLFESNKKYISEHIANITNIDVIRIECDIVSGSYWNGKICHTIHQFSHCKVSPGFKFIEVPSHLIYFPLKEREKNIRSIQISIVDQNGELIDFRGEQISCRIHIKRVNDYEIE